MTAQTAEKTPAYTLQELKLEAHVGAAEGKETSSRAVPRIDLSDFERRKPEITEQLWRASVDIGFFQLINHGIPLAEVRKAFETSEKFFALPNEIKAQYPLQKALNSGWESLAQVRPSLGTPDLKESYQITQPHMKGLWPTDKELEGFVEASLRFERMCWETGMKVLSCFADKLGFDSGFFSRAHDPSRPGYQSTLRFLHYYPIPPEARASLGPWRGGAHTDFDCLTLLFQQDGQGGLQVCPGKEIGDQEWTSVAPDADVITCNIGDMLMRWSDDQLLSNFHRVRNPGPEDNQGSRYSIAYFAQANRDVMIEGPGKKYPPISAADYLQQRVAANYAKY